MLDVLRFCMTIGLIAIEDKCAEKMKLTERRDVSDGFAWDWDWDLEQGNQL